MTFYNSSVHVFPSKQRKQSHLVKNSQSLIKMCRNLYSQCSKYLPTLVDGAKLEGRNSFFCLHIIDNRHLQALVALTNVGFVFPLEGKIVK